MVDEQYKVSSIVQSPILSSPKRNSSPRTINSRSQVRFSVPDADFLDGSRETVLGSPCKIVFPRSFEDDGAHYSANENLANLIPKLSNEGHFVDIHSGTIINIPEEIWNFHTRKKLTKEYLESSSFREQSLCNNDEELETSKLLQSIIVDTLRSVGKFHSDKSNETNLVLPLNARRENNYDLYLTSYSPLNVYNVPVPLEISLPPYLSPKNRGRQRNSLIFDGKNYSPFNVNDERTLQEDEGYMGDLEQNSLSSGDDEDASINANSIPPATHDISFDINSLNDVDQELGIDEYANVDLRAQIRNLKRESPQKKFSIIGRSGIIDEPPLDQGSDINDINELASPEPMYKRKSLDILSTPLKQIDIPDFELNPMSPLSTVGSLKFFDGLGNQEEEKHLKPNSETDELNMNYRFPSLPSKEDDDFRVTYSTPTDLLFETRKSRISEHAVASPRGHRDAHNRSRSIHSMQDMFVTSTPSPVATNTNKIFNRCTPLENHSLQEGGCKGERQVSSRRSRAGFAEDKYGLPFLKFNTDLPITPSPMERNKTERTMAPTPFSRRYRQKPIVSVPDKHYDCKADEKFLFLKNQFSHGKRGEGSPMGQESFVSGNQAVYNRTDGSLKIIAERNLNCDHEEIEVNESSSLSPPLEEIILPVQSMKSVNPVKSIQSFKKPVIKPDSEYEDIVSMHPEHLKINYRPLSPSRSLSNSDSQCSTNSQLSKQTQSSRTSYPIGLEITNPLTGKPNKSPICRPFSHSVESISANTRKSKMIPGFDHYDIDSIPSYQQLYEDTILLDDDRKNKQHRDIHHNSLASKDYNEPDYVLLSHADLDRECPFYNQRNFHIHQESGNFEEQNQKYDYDLYNEAKSSPPGENMRYEDQRKCRTERCFMGEELHESNDSQIFEEQRKSSQTLRYADQKPAHSVLYTQHMSPSSEFHEVLETLDSMISSTQRTESAALEEPLYDALEKPKKSKTKPIINVGYHTEYEKRGDKMVEILVLDDDSKDGVSHIAEGQDSLSSKEALQDNLPSRNRKKILKMCEDTASDAKDIIFQLIDDRKSKRTRKKKFTRPPPPVATKEMMRLLYDYHRHSRSNNPSITEERYLRNVKKAIRP